MTTPIDMTSDDLRALAQLVDDRKVVVVRHENLLAVLRPPEHHYPTGSSSAGVLKVSR